MREAAVENYLRQRVAELGGRCVKLNPQNAKGLPDRMVLLDKQVVFVELKRPIGGVLSAAQILWHAWLRRRDLQVVVLSTKGEIDAFIKRAETGGPEPLGH